MKGSSEYRVTVTFPSVETTKVRCTCPAHRRSAYCKHVVAVCTALLEQPATFAVLEALPEPPVAKKAPSRRRGTAAGKVAGRAANGWAGGAGPAAGRADGWRTGAARAGEGGVDRAVRGAGAGAEAATAGEPADAASAGGGRCGVAGAADRTGLDGAAFARLLLDLYLCRAATGAQLEGKVALDTRLAEDLLGKTWRARSWSR